MAGQLLWITLLTILSVTFAVQHDCESPPRVLHSSVRIDDDEDTVQAHYTCDDGFHLKGYSSIACNLDTDEWLQNAPICEQNDDPDGEEESESSDKINNGKKQKKPQEILEDERISSDYAKRLDMSCVRAKVKAPEIENGYVLKYERRKKDNNHFLVAFYACNPNFEMENLENSAVHCSKRTWIGEPPTCLSLIEYDEEDYGYEEGGDIVDENDDEDETETDNDEEKLDSNTKHETIPNNILDNEIDEVGTNEVHNVENKPSIDTTPSVNHENVAPSTDIPIVIPPTVDPYTPRVLNQSCGDDRGGCDQECQMLLYPGENTPRIVCSCYNGFTLDPYDYRRCHDIDECQVNNGGCEQICQNIPGSFKCSCTEGLQLSSVTGTSCEDIDECSNPDVANLCPYGCENTPGSYNCLVTDPNVNQIQQENESFTPSECETGLRRNSDGVCQDIDECAEGTSGCENCQNTFGSYNCICPTGFELSDNDKTCVDIDECQLYGEGEEEDDDNENREAYKVCSHDCLNLPGRFECKCPENYHLQVDQRTCAKDLCEDLKLSCSHECVNENESFKCICPNGHNLHTDLRTCIHEIDKCDQLGGYQKCQPGNCLADGKDQLRCLCPSGYMENGLSCVDIDECADESLSLCSHYCTNTEGSFQCLCPDGFKLMPGSITNCTDVNECEENVDICNGLYCENSLGGYQCLLFEDSCPPGLIISADRKTCILSDPCANNKNGCSQICDSQRSGQCSCEEGFQLLDDKKTCQDIDECTDNNNGGCEQICVNHSGGYKCLCKAGFKMLNSKCFDIDECVEELNHCRPGLTCENLIGSFKCLCPVGYTFGDGTPTECFDIDECLLNNGNCSHFCINLPGGYQCSCPSGQMLIDDERTCNYVDECLINNGGCSHKCSYLTGSLVCSCPAGFQLDKTLKICQDTDECAINNGGCSQLCHNSNGSFACACDAGYILDKDAISCFDIDECIENNGNCSNICINLLGSHSCACEAGFKLQDDLATCQDVDECSFNIHDCSHICVNSDGGYDCTCPPGLILSQENRLSCIDVNECATNRGETCSHLCINTFGSYYCQCTEGFVLDSDNKTCISSNLCNRPEAKCSHECQNIPDGFECLCPNGMSLSEDGFTCEDIDECAIHQGASCSHICENILGSYVCRCPVGYRLGNDMQTCFDINECEIENGRCSHYCVNIEGGHRCDCTDGYVLNANGLTCEYQNFCLKNNGGCDHICSSFENQVHCSCRPGYYLGPENNSTCHDIDECQSPNICPLYHSCRNTLGSYECDCPLGFIKNALGKCDDLNECEVSNGGCAGDCHNTRGSFRCTCPAGQRLSNDNKTCLEIRDFCAPLQAPKYGELHCTRSRNKNQLFYKTKCSVWCQKGYKLEGPSIRHCNGSGHWDSYENHCLPQLCPRLSRPEYGTILPSNCLLGKIYVGERCLLHCLPGFAPAGKRAAICTADQLWSTNSSLECIPIPTNRVGVPRPFIKCPQNTTLMLPNGQNTVYIRLERPKTNVDARFVESYPSWANNLEAHLTAGVHVITFRAKQPALKKFANCRTVITVKAAVAPKVIYCPTSFLVVLQQNQAARSITWKEPVFESKTQLKTIYKSHISGQLFTPGVYTVINEAIDSSGLSSKCEFKIFVRATPQEPTVFAQYNSYQNHTKELTPAISMLGNQESYILCPNKSPLKVNTNYPFHVPAGCFIKNVLTHPMQHFMKKRLLNRRWRHFRSF